MPIMRLYPILIERNLISLVVTRSYDGPPPRDFDPNLTCDFHFRVAGHYIENCKLLKHRVQDLINHRILKFEGVPNIKTNPLQITQKQMWVLSKLKRMTRLTSPPFKYPREDFSMLWGHKVILIFWMHKVMKFLKTFVSITKRPKGITWSFMKNSRKKPLAYLPEEW